MDGKTKPYSNIFYWAHAWTPGSKSTIGSPSTPGI